MKPIYIWTPLKKASEKGNILNLRQGQFPRMHEVAQYFYVSAKIQNNNFPVKLMAVSVVELNNLKMIVPNNCTFLLNYCYFELYICPSIAVIMEYEK